MSKVRMYILAAAVATAGIGLGGTFGASAVPINGNLIGATAPAPELHKVYYYNRVARRQYRRAYRRNYYGYGLRWLQPWLLRCLQRWLLPRLQPWLLSLLANRSAGSLTKGAPRMVLAQPRCLCIPATAGVMEEQWRDSAARWS